MPYTYEYPRAALTVDCVVLAAPEAGQDAHQVLLVRRGRAPYEGSWALPGGFLELHETLAEATRRELREETGLDLGTLPLEQLGAFDAVDRDPRERVISVVHIAFVSRDEHEIVAGDDASDARWFSLDALPALAFDHPRVLELARRRLEQRRASGEFAKR